MFGGICETNPPSNTSFLGTTPPSKAEKTPKKNKTQAARMATGEAKVEGTPKREKKFKYDCAKVYSVKTPLEDSYKVVVWDTTKAYNPALEEDCVALDYLAATYACFQDIWSNPRAEDMPRDSAPTPDDEKGVCRLCQRGHKSYGPTHCPVLLFMAGVNDCRELFCHGCLFSLQFQAKSCTYQMMGSAYLCAMCVKCSQLVPAGLLFSCTKGGEGQDTYVSVGGVLVDESPMVICVRCAQSAFPKKDAYKIPGVQHPAKPFQIAEDGSDYDYRKLYQLLLQILCYSEGVLSQVLLAMQHKQQGLIHISLWITCVWSSRWATPTLGTYIALWRTIHASSLLSDSITPCIVRRPGTAMMWMTLRRLRSPAATRQGPVMGLSPTRLVMSQTSRLRWGACLC